MISEYKYNSKRAIAEVFAELLSGLIEDEDYTIIPLPTISKHIRERGFDHMKLIARKIARRKKWRHGGFLRRMNSSVQVGASAEMRKKQAREAYFVSSILNSKKRYLLLDDVWTTGSSMLAAQEKIFQAGARKIDFMIIAKASRILSADGADCVDDEIDDGVGKERDN